VIAVDGLRPVKPTSWFGLRVMRVDSRRALAKVGARKDTVGSPLVLGVW
jgi:hypothetical protein